MQYVGKLWGKSGRRLIPLAMTSDDVDRLESENKKLHEICRKFVRASEDFPCGHKPNYESGPCETCAAVKEYAALTANKPGELPLPAGDKP